MILQNENFRYINSVENFKIQIRINFDCNDDHKCTLPAKFVEIARDELREDETRKAQALEQFREWIAKHPYIRNCRTDTPYLLRFLRFRKYSVPGACESLERYLSARQLYSYWFGDVDCDDPHVIGLLEDGYATVMKERDELGRRIIMVNLERFNTEKYTIDDNFRLIFTLMNTILEEEITQVSGFVLVSNEHDITMKFIGMISVFGLTNWVRCLTKSFPIRTKGIHIVNIPAIAKTLCELFVSILSEKFKNRTRFHESFVELKEHVDTKLLPLEYGGTIPMAEVIEYNKQLLRKNQENFHLEAKQSIAITSKLDADESMDVGSFRTLNID